MEARTIGSLFLSAAELAVKLSHSLGTLGAFLKYTSMEDVRNAIGIIPFEGSLKVKLLLAMFKLKLYRLVFFAFYCANKIRGNLCSVN